MSVDSLDKYVLHLSSLCGEKVYKDGVCKLFTVIYGVNYDANVNNSTNTLYNKLREMKNNSH